MSDASDKLREARDRDAGFTFRAEEAETVELRTPLGLATFNPVIYSATAGGGPNEYAASSDPNNPNKHAINMAVPGGKRIVAAWYTLTHNVPGVSGGSP